MSDHIFVRHDEWSCHGVLMLPGWYFWDETGDWHGPFSCKDEAEECLKAYCENELGERSHDL